MLNQTATIAGINAAHLESERIEKALIKTIQSDSAELHDKIEACRQLGTKGSKASVAPLAVLLEGDERLSHMARYGLETNPDSSVNEALREALGNVKGRNLMGVMVTLGNRRDEKAIEGIAKHLGDSDKHVSAAAARALGSIGTEEAFTALREAMRGDGVTDRASLYEGILRCANHFEESDKERAARIYDRLQQGEAPEYVKHGAKTGAARVG